MRRVAFVLGAAVVLATEASAQQPVGKPFQAHTPDGVAYWVVSCYQRDQCLEFAYKHCKGPYEPLDPNGIVITSGFRFQCRDALKKYDDATHEPAPKPQ